jgi:hypothetical protein
VSWGLGRLLGSYLDLLWEVVTESDDNIYVYRLTGEKLGKNLNSVRFEKARVNRNGHDFDDEKTSYILNVKGGLLFQEVHSLTFSVTRVYGLSTALVLWCVRYSARDDNSSGVGDF